MDDIELKNIEPDQPLIRTLTRSDSCIQEDRIDTEYGTLVAAVQGDRLKPALLTCHDIGLNHVSNFQSFFNFADTRVLMQSFCVYHINFPGQEENSATLPETYVYPTMDQLAEMLLPVLKFYGIRHFIGLGVGAGANVLSRFSLRYPQHTDGLFLINPTCTVAGWTEWGYQKLNVMHLRSSGMTASTQEYLMWHHFGRLTEDRSHDLAHVYRHYFSNSVNAYNLSLFIDSFIKRTDLGIVREMDPDRKKTAKNFKCHVLLLCGSLSPHLEDSVTMNSRMDPTNSTWMKLSGCGMVLEEEPAKVSEAFGYFLQGLGYALNQFRRKSSVTSTISTEDASSVRCIWTQSMQKSAGDPNLKLQTNEKMKVHIVENPINIHNVIC